MAYRAAVATLLATLALALHLILAQRFRRLDVFEQTNVLFHADISTRLEAISGGRHLGIKHPNLMPYFTPPIALLTKVIVALHPASGPEPALRQTLGVWVVPAACALKTALIFMLLMRFGLPWAQAAVVTVLEMLSFTTLIFGSIPESYGLTALALTLAYLLAVAPGSPLTSRRIVLWVAVGVVATGITVTNIVMVALLLWSAAWFTATHRVIATLQVAAVVVAIFAVTAVSAYGLDWLLVPPRGETPSPR